MRFEVCLQRRSSLAAASCGDGDKSAPWIRELGVVSSGIAGTAPDPRTVRGAGQPLLKRQLAEIVAETTAEVPLRQWLGITCRCVDTGGCMWEGQ